MTTSTENAVRDHIVKVNDTFGMPNVPDSLVALGFANDTHPLIPKADENYVFRRENLNRVLDYLDDPYGKGFFVWGHSGTGKTSMVYQVASRLNWPVQAVNGHMKLDFDDLCGCWKMGKDGMEWIYGPLAIAVREGHIFVLNECDRVDPGQLVGLHDVLEGHPLKIAGKGDEFIPVHPNFRIMCTANSPGSGDQTGLYAGVNILDQAFMARFRTVRVHYPSIEVEDELLARKSPDIPSSIRTKMITFANIIRKLFIGDDSSDAQPLTVTMSTRELDLWAHLVLKYRGAPNAYEYALNEVVLERTEPEQQTAILRIAKDVFGDDWS